MDYDPKPLERPQHLLAHVTGMDEAMVDERIRRVDRKTPIWHCSSEEVWTPRSLSLFISITLGAKNGLDVWTADTRPLQVHHADVWTDVSLLLPTEEVLRVRVEERRYGALRAE